jgi:hypothetical protein
VVSGDADTNAQFTFTIASDVSINPVDITITDNAAASTGTIYGLEITNADNAANVGVPDGLARLENANAAETVPAGLIIEQTGAGTLTDALQILETAGTITTAINIGNNIGTGLAIGTGLTADIDITDASGVIKMASGATLTIGDTGADVFTIDLTNNWIRIGDGTDNLTFDVDSGPDYNGTARPTKTATLVPEFAGAVLTPDGGSNGGTMTSDFCSEDNLRNVNTAATPTDSAPCDNDVAEEHNYYSWDGSGGSAQDYDIWIHWQVPSDFDGFDTLTDAIQAYGWRADDTTNEVRIYMYDTDGVLDNASGTVVSTSTTPAAWTLTTVETTPGGTYAQGSYVTFQIKMTADSGSDTVKVGELIIDYKARY